MIDPKPEKKQKVTKRSCRVCRERFVKTFPNVWWCSPECGVKYAKTQVKKVEDNAWKKRKKILREDIEKLDDIKARLQPHINEIIRLLDKGHGCISCNKLSFEHAGHFHSRGAKGWIQFVLLNIWGQCAECNTHLSANIHAYDRGLIELFGREKWDYIKFDIPLKEYAKLSKPELRECIVRACEIKNKLIKKDERYTREERWQLRVDYWEFIFNPGYQ